MRMDTMNGVGFVGLYASFPIENDRRRVEILRTVLDMEAELRFKRIRYGSILGKLKDSIFDEKPLTNMLQSLENGEADYLQLFPYNIGDDWVQVSKMSMGLDWTSNIIRPLKRPSSPIEKRFGNAGHLIVQYPESRFVTDSDSEFQKNLLNIMKRLFVEEEIHWAFIHRGFHFTAPSSIGTDDLFLATREKFPLTSFDTDLGRAVFFKEFVKGAFWANFLNPLHVKNLGGIERMRNERPCRIIEELDNGRVLLQVGPSPLVADEKTATEDYQRLRRFLKPILMESGDDMMRIQRKVLGSWKPPESGDQGARGMLTEMKDRDS